MEGTAHPEREDPAGTRLPGAGGEGRHRGDLAAHHHLAGGVEVGHDHDPCGLPAEPGDDARIEAEHGGHRPLPHRRHQAAPRDGEAQRRLGLECAGHAEGGELPDRMAGDRHHGEVPGQRGGQGQLGEDQGRLGHLGGADQLLVAGERRPQIAPVRGGGGEEAPADVGGVEPGGHGGRLAALAREAERDPERRRAHSVAITSRRS